MATPQIKITAIDNVSKTLDKISNKMYAAQKPVKNLTSSFAKLKASSGLNKISGNISTVGSSMMSTARIATYFTGAVTGAVAGLYAVSSSAYQSVYDIEKFSTRLNITRESLQTLSAAGMENGATMEETADALKDLSKNSQDAITGNLGMRDAFAQVGIGVEQLRKLKPDELILLIADRYAASKRKYDEALASGDAKRISEALVSENAKVQNSMQMMGEAGLKAIPMLNKGSEAITNMRKQMEEDGAFIDDVSSGVVKSFEQMRNRLGRQMLATKVNFGATLMPVFTQIMSSINSILAGKKEQLSAIFLNIANALNVLLTKMLDFITSSSGMEKISGFFENLPKYASQTFDVLSKIAVVAGALLGVFVTLTDAIGVDNAMWVLLALKIIPAIGALVSITATIVSLTSALGVFGAIGAIVFSPIIIAIGLLGLAAYLVYTRWEKIVSGSKLIWSQLINIFEIIYNEIIELWSGLTGAFTDIFDVIVNFASVNLSDVFLIFDKTYNGIIAIWGDLTGFFTDIFNNIVKFASDKFNGVLLIFDTIYNKITDKFATFKNLISPITDLFGNDANVTQTTRVEQFTKQQQTQVGGTLTIKTDPGIRVTEMKKDGAMDIEHQSTGMIMAY